MIPKKIHYCWFGKTPLPVSVLKCIETWKQVMPDYEIIQWNEDNFDINCCPYVSEAYKSKKFAFVSDYVRLNALEKHGGVYLDTDIEVLKPLDKFLNHDFFIGYEGNQSLGTGVIGSIAKHPILNNLLDWYQDKHFIGGDGKLFTVANTKLVSDYFVISMGWIKENTRQDLNLNTVVYPFEVFCAKDWKSGKIVSTKDTYTVHHFSGTWFSKREKVIFVIKRSVYNLLNQILKKK